MMVDSFISNLFTEHKYTDEELYQVKKRLIYRHLAWLYAHRSQLLLATLWEHISQGGHVGKTAQRYQNKFGSGLIEDEVTKSEKSLNSFLSNVAIHTTS